MSKRPLFTLDELASLKLIVQREIARGQTNRSGETAHVGVRLDTGLRDALQKYADGKGIKLSQAIHQAIEFFLTGKFRESEDDMITGADILNELDDRWKEIEAFVQKVGQSANIKLNIGSDIGSGNEIRIINGVKLSESHKQRITDFIKPPDYATFE